MEVRFVYRCCNNDRQGAATVSATVGPLGAVVVWLSAVHPWLSQRRCSWICFLVINCPMPPTAKKYSINNFYSVNTNFLFAYQMWSTVVCSWGGGGKKGLERKCSNMLHPPPRSYASRCSRSDLLTCMPGYSRPLTLHLPQNSY